MDVEGLADPVFRLDVVFVEVLRSAVELDLGAFAHARPGAQPAQLFGEVVLTGDRADEHAVGIVEVALASHGARFRRRRAVPFLADARKV